MRAAATVARDLGLIADMATRLRGRALDQANDHEMPGGSAMMHLGPTASPQAYAHQLDLAEQEAIDGDRPWPESEDSDDHDMTTVLWALWFWSEQWRRELGVEVSDRHWKASVASEARFLAMKETLDHAWEDHGWEDFAQDVADARTQLEDVLREGERAERSRVICNRCDAGKPLVRKYGKKFTLAWRCRCCGYEEPERRVCNTCGRTEKPDSEQRCQRRYRSGDECPGVLVTAVELNQCPRCETCAPAEPVRASDPADDRWKCPACKKLFTDPQADEAYREQMRSAGAEKWVTLASALSVLHTQGTAERTVRRWVSPLRPYDHCGACGNDWEHGKHPACPRIGCSAPLHVRYRDARRAMEAVPRSWCDRHTHTTWIWWPDLWYLQTRWKAEAPRRQAEAARQRLLRRQRDAMDRARREARRVGSVRV